MNKTLIGKNDYLFLINDQGRELEIHCNNLDVIYDKELKRYNKNNFSLIVIPNKSLIYKKYLPDIYDVKYRPSVDIYKTVLKDKIIDCYDILKNKENVYYKTDTHINVKGSYIVYKHFINEINKMYNLNLKPKKITLLQKQCVLSELQLGIGDLLWELNLGNQIVENKLDTFYYSNDFEYIYKTLKKGMARYKTVQPEQAKMNSEARMKALAAQYAKSTTSTITSTTKGW
jgi:ferredoxin-fold anticodon binding domain-containing protein